MGMGYGFGSFCPVRDRVVDEVLVEAAIADGGGERDLAGNVLGKAEAVADQLRAAGLEGVVVGQHAVVPDLVQVVELALDVDQAVGEGVGAGVEIAVGLDESALGEGLAAVLDGEVDPGFVEVALLGNEGVADALVLDDDVGDQGFSGSEEKLVRPSGATRTVSLAVASALSFSRAKMSTLKTPLPS
jgi:hypothetical protein